MQRIRQHFLTRILCGLVAAIILNICVDAPDLYDDSVPEDLSYNDIESVAEWVVEDFLHIENAFPEHDDNDSPSPLKNEKTNLFYFEQQESAFMMYPIFDTFEVTHNFGYVNFYNHSAINELIQPPDA